MAFMEMLKQAEAFHLLTDETLSTIETFCSLREFQHGDRLFKERDAADYLEVVVEGVVDLRFDLPGRETSPESTISSVSKNNIIGWSSLIQPYQYKLAAYCDSAQCKLLMIERQKLLAYFKENPKTGYQVFSAMLRLVGKRFERLQQSAGEVLPVLDTANSPMPACGLSAEPSEKMINPEVLEQTDVFNGLTDKQMSVIRQCADMIDFKKDDRIFAQGDNASHVWIMREGEVRLQTESGENKGVDGKPLMSFMSQAHAFGWTCFVPPYKYRLSGYCDSRWCSLLRFSRVDLRRIFEEDFVIGFQVMSYLMEAVGSQFMQYQDAMARNRGIEMMNQW
jgi:signal-transduction protein with cAMP-binding, CBS, and nucleotidyltransferase domain